MQLTGSKRWQLVIFGYILNRAGEPKMEIPLKRKSTSMSTPTGHQGGLLKSASAHARAPLPVHRNDTGAKREEMPTGVKIPNMRHAISPNEVCQRKWVREIID